MNGRSGVVTFFIFLFLITMIVFQILGMIQSDRLYERLNQVLSRSANDGGRKVAVASAEQKPANSNATAEEYPGDEGDWLVWGEGGEVRTLNLLSTDITQGTVDISSNIVETLFEQDLDSDKTKLKPRLAEKMDISPDGKEIIVTLKKDIHFSDGVPVTADDVIFTFETMMNPKIDCASLRSYYQNISDVIKLNDHAIKFIIKERYWKTISMIGELYVFPKHIYGSDTPEEFNKRITNPIGSGPYVFEKWDVGQNIVLKRNPNYWGKKPNIGKLVFRFITNATACLQALQSHEIDIFEPGSEQVVEMPKNQAFAKEFKTLVFWDPMFGYWYVGWNEARPFFKDSRVRLAMTYLFDRENIVKQLTKGNGAVVSGPFYIYGRQSNPDIKPWPYDPTKAKQLLDEAGWIDRNGDGIREKDGIPFRFKYSYVTGNTSSEQEARLFKDEATQAGIDVILDPIEYSIFVERINASDFDAVESAWTNAIESDPYQIFHSSQIKDRGNNRVGFNNPQADELIEKARRELDENKRYELYHQLHKLLHEEQPYTFLMTRPRYYFIDKRFENVIVHKLGIDSREWYVPSDKQKYR